MELRRLAAERRHADRVLEQPAGVGVVSVRRRRVRGEVAVGEDGAHRRREAVVRQLAGEKLEEAVAARRHRGARPASGSPGRPRSPRASARRAGAGRGTARRVRARAPRRPRRSARRAVRRRSRPAPRSVRTGRRARARGTAPPTSSAASASSSPRTRPRRRGPPPGRRSRGESTVGSGRAQGLAVSRAPVRRAEAGPLAELIAPPYDVIDDAARLEYLARSPYNVVHLTLPDTPEEAGAALADWRARRRAGRGGARALVARAGLRRAGRRRAHARGARRSDRGDAVLGGRGAAARADARRPEGGAAPAAPRDAHAARADLPALRRRPAVRAAGRRARARRGGGRRPHAGVAPSTAGASTSTCRCSSPTAITGTRPRSRSARRIRRRRTRSRCSSRRARRASRSSRPTGSCRRSPPNRRCTRSSPGIGARSALYRGGEYFRVDSDDELDARAVERYVANGVGYTPYAEAAVAAVDRGEAEAAFLVRAPTVAQVAAFAARGETMPQKSTFFFPKLTSGLLLFPL